VKEFAQYINWGPIWLGRLSVGWEGRLKGEGGPRSV